jgi:hypothetical protein
MNGDMSEEEAGAYNRIKEDREAELEGEVVLKPIKKQNHKHPKTTSDDDEESEEEP